MNIDKYESAMKACRFCFMCRHLSPVGNVTFSESDTPRGRALMLDKVSMNGEYLKSEAVVSTIFKADLSACCFFHCVSSYDENGLVLAARRDIVEAGAAPAKVAELAAGLAKDDSFKVAGTGETAFFTDKYTASDKAITEAFKKLAARAKIKYSVISGGCIGKALKVLGYESEAVKNAKKFAAAVKKSGAKIIVVSNPAAFDALKNDFPKWGIKLGAEVMHTSDFLLGLFEGGKLKAAKKAPAAYYLESDFLKNYNANHPAPRKLLAALGCKVKPFGTNNEESYSAGEGACVLPELEPELVKKLAEKVVSRADDPKRDLLVTASPYTKKVLCAAGLKVVTLEEYAASLI